MRMTSVVVPRTFGYVARPTRKGTNGRAETHTATTHLRRRQAAPVAMGHSAIRRINPNCRLGGRDSAEGAQEFGCPE